MLLYLYSIDMSELTVATTLHGNPVNLGGGRGVRGGEEGGGGGEGANPRFS